MNGRTVLSKLHRVQSSIS